MIRHSTISLETQGDADVHDITGRLSASVADSGLTCGIATAFCPSSTSALTTLEFEPGAVRDLRRLLDEIVPSARDYAHNSRWGDGNGHSHVRAALLGPSLTIPFVDRTLTLGTWQQVVFIDFDLRPRHRELVLLLVGE